MIDLKSDVLERGVLKALDDAARHQEMLGRFDVAACELDRKLATEPDLLLAWQTIPLESYDIELPEQIRSSWIFILRARVATIPERHPNSHQRMMAYRGTGDFQVWDGAAWRSNHLAGDFNRPLEKRWISIPTNYWHRSMNPPENLVVVSFHTATEEDLIEENGDPLTSAPTHQRRYARV